MPEPPDFEQIAEQLVNAVPLIDVNWKRHMLANIAEQLRRVWNARGGADLSLIRSEDGIWLSLRSPSGQAALINLSQATRSPIVLSVLDQVAPPAKERP